MGENVTVICLEGIVGAGKTTNIELLYNYFSPNCYLIPELNDISPMKEIREEIRSNGRMSNLNREDVIKIVEARGKIHQRLLDKNSKQLILMDRGIYTGMIFENGPLSMWDMEKISKEYGVITPDICFVLYCNTLKALERVDQRRVIVGKYKNRAFHENEEYINQTKERYFEIAKNRPVKLIETSGKIEDIQKIIIGEIHNAGIL